MTESTVISLVFGVAGILGGVLSGWILIQKVIVKLQTTQDLFIRQTEEALTRLEHSVSVIESKLEVEVKELRAQIVELRLALKSQEKTR